MDISKTHIAEMLQSNNLWLVRGILAIYRNQTADEQRTACTKHRNGVGFTGPDAEFLSSLAVQIIRKVRNGMMPRDVLSDKQLKVARKLMPKYAGQLHRIALERIGSTTAA